MNGVILIDKPPGMTSHDVVSALRRKLGTKRVGHAGTLDPMATGLLVVLIGEATKLEPYLASGDKGYVATVELGRSTSTLDAEGETTAEAPVDPALFASPLLDEAIARELARVEQIPPAFSAIHVQGKRSYERARAGEEVVLPPRLVRARSIRRLEVDAPARRLTCELIVSKGYYVRSFARDLGEALGVPSHLQALRRTSSGMFALGDASALDATASDLEASAIPLVRAATSHLPVVALADTDRRNVEMGRPIPLPPNVLVEAALFALVDSQASRLVAIASRDGDRLVVVRGFNDA